MITNYIAERARRVVSYEPNTRNRSRLAENIRLNRLDNVTVRPVGVGSKAETVVMAASPLIPGGASIDPDAVSRLRNSNLSAVSEQVAITTLDEDIQEMKLPAPDFIKIDIEGGELAALTGARRTLAATGPQLFLEMHGSTMNQKRAKVAAIVEFLREAGYADILHVESGMKISPENSAVAAEGHLYCPGR